MTLTIRPSRSAKDLFGMSALNRQSLEWDRRGFIQPVMRPKQTAKKYNPGPTIPNRYQKQCSEKVVGDPGIEPGVRLREGVTVPCHTLRPVALTTRCLIRVRGGVNCKIPCLRL